MKKLFTPGPVVSFQSALILNSDLVETELQSEQQGYLSEEKNVVKYT